MQRETCGPCNDRGNPHPAVSDVTADRTALLAGATGLVGSHVLARLLASQRYRKVLVLVRRPLGAMAPKLEQQMVDFGRIEAFSPAVAADDVFCCLGTTIRVAGSQAAFRRVDHDYPVAFARMAARNGAQRFAMISSLGAEPGSSVFYSRVKGETEADVAALALPHYWFVRPSLLAGQRAETRIGERIGLAVAGLIGPLMVGSLRRYRAIHADTVAAAMLAVATTDRVSGPVESDELQALGT